MKRLRLTLLTITALLAIASAGAYDFAVANEDGVVIYYDRNGSNATVTNYGHYVGPGGVIVIPKYTGNVVIPQMVNYNGNIYTVTAISSSAFTSCKELVSVTIPSTITSIAGNAFKGCSSLLVRIDDLESWCQISFGDNPLWYADSLMINDLLVRDLVFPASVNNICSSAFSNFSGLDSVTIGGNIKSIGSSAFGNCSSLNTVTIEDSNELLGLASDAFSGSKIENVYIGRELSSWTGFSNNSSLLSVGLGHFVTNVGDNAFKDCNSLSSISLPYSIQEIGNYAFYNCSSLTSMLLRGQVTEIGCYAFYDCSGLTSLELPNSLTSIGEYAFRGCEGLTELTLPSSLTSIANSSFEACSGLTSVSIPESVTSIGDWAFKACSSLTQMAIPSSVKSVGEYAFSNCTELKSLRIEDSETQLALGRYTFEGDDIENIYIGRDLTSWTELNLGASLLTAEFGNTITTIGAYAFKDCSSLTSILIPESVTSIGEYAFYDCSVLTSIELSNAIAHIGSYAFRGCIGLTELSLPTSLTSIANSSFEACSGLTSVSIPESVTSIGDWAFKACSALTEISLPSAVEVLGTYVFAYCTSITSASLPQSLTTIPAGAFMGCSSLSNILIPEAVTSIGASAFDQCEALSEIWVPENVRSIGDSAFAKCYNLKKVFNSSTLTFTKGSTSYGYIAYYADNIFNNLGCAIGDYIFDNDTPVHLVAYIGEDTDLTLPADCQGESYEIGWRAFYNCSNLTSVTIPEGATAIGSEAFRGCTALTSVSIPNSVTSIGGAAFYGCHDLKALVIEDGESELIMGSCYTWDSYNEYHYYPFSNYVIEKLYIGRNLSSWRELRDSSVLFNEIEIGDFVTSIGEYAFKGCSDLTSVTLGNSVTSIGYYSFSGCTGLTSVIIPDSVSTIGSYSFSGCTGLTSVIIPDSVTSIDTDAFSDCRGLTSVTIGNSVTSVGVAAFSGCTGLTSVTIPESVTSIGSAAFSDCTGLTSVTIGNSVTSIGSSAFSGCTGLSSLTIPSSVTSIDKSAFRACTGIKTLRIEDGDLELELYSSDSNYYPFKECEIENLYVGRNLSSWQALCYSPSLTTVEIGNSVTSMGYRTFYGCTDLDAVIIGNSVTSIEDGAFRDCTSLTSVTIGKSVETIGKNAFYGCKELTSVIIPESVTSIGDSSFYNCIGLTSVTIPNSVTSIGSSAFSGCSGLTSVTIPNSVTSIGSSAFSGCSGLTSVTIPNSVTSIGISAFLDCNGLTSVTIPNSVTSIGSCAFKNCRGLKTLRIEDGESELSLYDSDSYYYPFKNCAIENLYVGRNLSSWAALSNSSSLKKVEIGSSVTSIGSSAFSGCNVLTSVTIPNSITSIGWGAFQNCTGLTSVTIPNSVTSIGKNAFSGCQKLINVSIPESVTSLASDAFTGCSHLCLDLSKSTATISPSAFSGIKSLIVGTNVKFTSGSSSGNQINVIWLPNSTPLIKGKVTYTASDLNHLSSYFKVDGFTFVPISPSERTCKLIDCDYLTDDAEVAVPDKVNYRGIDFYVTSIGKYAMAEQDGITDFEFNEFMDTLPEGLFYNCRSLSNVSIPGNTQTVHENTFYNCKSLTDLVIPVSVGTVNNLAFKGCTALANLTIEDTNKELNFTYSSNKSTLPFEDCAISSLYVGRNLSSWEALCLGSPLKEAVIGDSVTMVRGKAFYGCSSLESMAIPGSVKSLGSQIFQGCSSLRQVSLSGSLPSIPYQTFHGCSSLESITIPMSVVSVGASAFYGCSALSEVNLLDGEFSLEFADSTPFYGSPLESVLIGRNISGATFRELPTLKTAWITDVVTYMPDYLFYHCTGLQNLYVGDGIKTISIRAFSGCSSLRLFNVGRNVETIGNNALSDCTSITDIYAESMTPPTVYAQGLDDINKWECTLHYPEGAPYDTAPQWKEFLFTDTDFAVTMPVEVIAAEVGDVVMVTASVDESIKATEVVWRSSNPEIAEIVDSYDETSSRMSVRQAVGKTVSVNVLVHKKEPVTIAAFLPTGQMANCIINGEGVLTGIDTLNPDVLGPMEEISDTEEYTVFTLQGVQVLRNADASAMRQLTPGIYIVNGRKVMVK